MATHETSRFLTGVIEGFYGQPWTRLERFELFDQMARLRLNTYVYAPKDDLKHRTLWREAYSASDADMLQELIRACRQRKLQFIYALSPGLSLRYSRKSELGRLQKRFEQLLGLGCSHFALLFDDIPDRLAAEDIRHRGSLASAQCHVANALFRWTRERSPGSRFLFCPTPYCGRMAERGLGGQDYLAIVGRELLPELDIFWTGPEIISREISAAHARQLQAVLRRKPLIWDNLYANDYDGRRFFCGPYAGRPLALRNAVSGLLISPNCEFPLNHVPLRTLAEFVRCRGQWKPRKAYLAAMREWLPRFATAGTPVTLDDLVLFGDCHYLPHEEGPQAEALLELANGLVNEPPGPGSRPFRLQRERRGKTGAHVALDKTVTADWAGRAAAFRNQTTRLREFCARMADLRDRPLFHALSRRTWDLREELDLLLGYVDHKSNGKNTPFSADSMLPGTYRGGMTARLQRLLAQQPDGTFTP